MVFLPFLRRICFAWRLPLFGYLGYLAENQKPAFPGEAFFIGDAHNSEGYSATGHFS
jgi:hypothetical protein